MSHPLQATLEDRDGRWVLSFTRDLGHPVEAVLAVADRTGAVAAMVAGGTGPGFDGVGPRRSGRTQATIRSTAT